MLRCLLYLLPILTVSSISCDDLLILERVLNRSTSSNRSLTSTTEFPITTDTTTISTSTDPTTTLEEVHRSSTTASPTTVIGSPCTEKKKNRKLVEVTDNTTAATSSTATTTILEEMESSSVDPSTTFEVTDSETESETTPSARATFATKTTNAPLAGFRESIVDLDKPDLSQVYRRLFPYMNSNHH